MSLDSVRTAFFLSELNGLDVMAADVGNAYLHGLTKEMIYTVAGTEFGPELEGRILVVHKALYGLKTSMARWHEALSDKLRLLGFRPSKADPDLWMREADDHYEYVAVYSDDLLVFSKQALSILRGLESLFPLKGVGKPEFYLGGDVTTLCTANGYSNAFSAKTYIKNVCDKIERLFDVTLRNYGSPLEGGYHPELDTSELLTGSDVSKYRMLIGSANWAVTLGRFDIHFAVSTMGRYSAAPRKGHMAAMIRVFGYLKHHMTRRIVTDTAIPDHSSVELTNHDWSEMYPYAEEELPPDMPDPKVSESESQSTSTLTMPMIWKPGGPSPGSSYS